MPNVDRREFVKWGLAGAAMVTSPWMAEAAETNVRKSTHTYKTVGDLEIKADVYHSDDQVKRPVVVWIHGGALILGHRESIDKRVKRMMLERGYVLVSIDYRLAPETQLPAIIEDVEDAFRWVREQ